MGLKEYASKLGNLIDPGYWMFKAAQNKRDGKDLAATACRLAGSTLFMGYITGVPVLLGISPSEQWDLYGDLFSGDLLAVVRTWEMSVPGVATVTEMSLSHSTRSKLSKKQEAEIIADGIVQGYKDKLESEIRQRVDYEFDQLKKDGSLDQLLED